MLSQCLALETFYRMRDSSIGWFMASVVLDFVYRHSSGLDYAAASFRLRVLWSGRTLCERFMRSVHTGCLDTVGAATVTFRHGTVGRSASGSRLRLTRRKC
jgi:hypothetical protein